MLILTLFSCSEPADPPAFDTSYKDAPILEEAAIQCEGDALRITARTKGWHEYAVADLWLDPTDISEDGRLEVELVSEGFTRDEFCDVMAGTLEPSALGAPCTGTVLQSATVLIRVNYEEGCAGCALSGQGAPEVGLLALGDLAIMSGEDCDERDEASCSDVAITPNAEVSDCPETETTLW